MLADGSLPGSWLLDIWTHPIGTSEKGLRVSGQRAWAQQGKPRQGFAHLLHHWVKQS